MHHYERPGRNANWPQFVLPFGAGFERGRLPFNFICSSPSILIVQFKVFRGKDIIIITIVQSRTNKFTARNGTFFGSSVHFVLALKLQGQNRCPWRGTTHSELRVVVPCQSRCLLEHQRNFFNYWRFGSHCLGPPQGRLFRFFFKVIFSYVTFCGIFF